MRGNLFALRLSHYRQVYWGREHSLSMHCCLDADSYDRQTHCEICDSVQTRTYLHLIEGLDGRGLQRFGKERTCRAQAFWTCGDRCHGTGTLKVCFDSDPQSDPQNVRSHTTSVVSGAPHGFVSR
jgi:hypothetical protein